MIVTKFSGLSSVTFLQNFIILRLPIFSGQGEFLGPVLSYLVENSAI
jgi:hypothetical protein